MPEEIKLPPVESLTARQQRGQDCVLCARVLVAGNVTDLGTRLINAHGTSALWFPRVHPRCLTGNQQ